MPDGPVQDEKFIKGHKKWKNHNWLAYAAGYIYSIRNNFGAAYDAYKVASKNNKTLSSLIALDAERVKRLLILKRRKKVKTLVQNADIDYYNEINKGKIEDKENNPSYAYYLLGLGKIQEAYRHSKKFDTSKNYMGYLIAASKGATKQMRQEILQIGNKEKINLNSVWSAIGISIKEGQNYDEAYCKYKS